ATAGRRTDRLGASVTRQRECASARGGEQTGKDPTNRGKLGTQRHVVVDRHGVPLAVTLSGANVHHSKLLQQTVHAISAPRLPYQRRGRPRKRPTKLHADKGYDYPRCRRALRARGIIPRIARRGIESSERLGRHRWVVEGTQPHYLQDTLDVQERGAHYWAHRAAEPPSCGNETASSSGPGLPGRWCAMSVVTAANAACSFLTSTVVPAEPSDRDASGPPRPRRRRR